MEMEKGKFMGRNRGNQKDLKKKLDHLASK
jgi:hypothetical protein